MSRYVLPHLPMARTLDEASDSFAFMALDSSLEGVSGKFYGEKKAIPSSPESYDEARQERLWALSEALTAASGKAAA